MTVLSRGIKHLDKAYLSGVMTLWKETRTLSEKRVLIYSNGALILSLLEMNKVKIQQISQSHFVKCWKTNSTMRKYYWRAFIWMVTT